MKQIFFICMASCFLFMGTNPMESIPQAEISNGLIKARLYLPDSKTGYYRGSRFDWSGVIPALEYNGHTYFGQWFDKYSPTLHDAIMGPVDDFYPIGYSDAKPGETFLKIGIGTVAKPEETKYSFSNYYPIVNGGTWKVKAKADRVEFTQKFDDKEYAYEYQKTVSLTKAKPELVIEHVLKNTSSKLLETTVYNHNFFVLDKVPIGPDVEVTFPFNLTSEIPGNEAFGKIQDNKIVFHKTLEKNEHLFYGSLQGFGNTNSDYDIRIENRSTGAGVRITCEQPISKLVFWSASKTVCPEPYIQLSVKPGETFRWAIVYQFYTSDTK